MSTPTLGSPPLSQEAVDGSGKNKVRLYLSEGPVRIFSVSKYFYRRDIKYKPDMSTCIKIDSDILFLEEIDSSNANAQVSKKQTQ